MSPPAQSQSQSNPQIVNFLNNILSQRGPTSLPYSEDVKWHIRNHLLTLVDAFPSLHIKTAPFTHNDGRTVNLLQADGTIPMLYQNVTYNIPIIIWLLEHYPRQPPLVFVNPTRDMIIKRPHANVTPSGLVNLGYLQRWVYPGSNLVDLGRDLSACFARDPPLYSQRKAPPSPVVSSSGSGDFGGGGRTDVNPNPNVNLNPNQNTGGGGFGGFMGRVFPPSPYGRTEDPNEVYRRNAMSKLVEMVHGDVGELRKSREEEMDGLFAVQAVLRQREEKVNRGLREMSDEKEGLENQLQVVLTNADVLEGWLRENEEKMGRLGVGGSNVDVDVDVDVDDAFEPCDVLSKQMMEASASDLAIEDVIYALDKAVQEGVIPFDQYLRNVRLLSREQFFHRAMSAKVRASQMQAHVASMAARTSQYVM